ncbi:ABC transporter permease [Chitinophaga vietnamensis]|uniref:ABC transporter permease n=1 Tax=Chitinophaga vietnamensis TaxID=2593957 RepID=UPI0011773E60|nr:ABC transporter permease [Chitinophaga vietnamensis]
MSGNYIKIAIRNLLKSPAFSLINICGLAAGLTACILLALYVRSELSYDQHQQHAASLYLVNSEAMIASGAKEEYPMLSASYGPALSNALPEVQQSARLFVTEDKTLLQVQPAGQAPRAFYETRGCQADPSFFQLFSYHFLEGDSTHALQETNSIVITDILAKKLFGENAALNQVITLGGNSAFKVTGVVRDESYHSHIDAHFFLPLNAGWLGDFLRTSTSFATNNMFYTYVRLQPGADPKLVDRKLAVFMKDVAGKDLQQAGFSKRIFLVPVTDLHLYDGLNTIVTAVSSRSYLYIMASIALFILVIGCVNFMNLSTARSIRRATEVGIRKALGARKQELIRQFLGESFILTFFALLLAAGLTALLLPLFSRLSGKDMNSLLPSLPYLAAAFIGLALVTGFVAGSYPAFYLAAFKPLDTLKGRFNNSIPAIALRKGLVVFQFVIACTLILATLTVRHQLDFLRKQPLGFEQEQQIVIPLRSNAAQHAYTVLCENFMHNSQVKSAAGTTFYPGIPNPTTFSLYRADQTVNDIQQVNVNWVAPGFLESMDFKLAAGRFFRAGSSDTSNRLVVNEATLRKFGVPLSKAVGQQLHFNFQGKLRVYEITGVVKDFHFEDLRKPIAPYAFLLNASTAYSYIVVHANTADMRQTIAALESKWKAQLPGEPFEYTFLSDDFQRNYNAEQRTFSILNYFTLIAILISVLGLFGLATFDVQQRTREIGIRKTLGATTMHIAGQLSGNFIRLVLLAFVMAGPLAYFAMQQWLQHFAYHTQMSWQLFAAAGIGALLLALAATGYQALKAAAANPVKCLRTE